MMREEKSIAVEQNQLQITKRVVVVIKALNEEKHIRRCLESALLAVRSLDGAVVLADSGSTDATISIAMEYPVTVVQLANTAERCCGIGAQLGYQFTNSEYIYVLDGDMALEIDFLPQAIAYMTAHPHLAGVAGLVEELGGGNYEFEARKAQSDGRILGCQHALDMGGLYRGEALRAIGYLTNRNLHSYEEKELGIRLLTIGYQLERIAIPAIKHYGKTETSLRLLLKRWKSHHIDGPGEWMRATWRQPVLFRVAMMFKQLWLVFFSWLWLLFGLIYSTVSVQPLLGAIVLQGIFLARFIQKNRSLSYGLIGFIHIHFYTAGMIRGLLSPQIDPGSRIVALVVKECDLS